MPRILMIVSSATSIPTTGGEPHPTGYWAEEVIKPFQRFTEAGAEVVAATPEGRKPQADPWGLEFFFHYPDEDEDFLMSVLRSFAPDVEDIRVTLHHLTEINLIAARRIFLALRDAGLEAEEARRVVEACAKTSWREDRDYIDVLAADDVVSSHLTRRQIQAHANGVKRAGQAESKRVAEELEAIETLNHPLGLRQMNDEDVLGFDAVFIPGGHGPMVDLVDNPDVGWAIETLHAKDRTVAALCHGPVALLSAGEGPDGDWLFDGYKMTAFTDEEEDQTLLGRAGMPYYIEHRLKGAGGIYDDGDAAWASHVVVDRNLITAQNPASSEAAADAVLKRLGVL
jgi:putative intracellular protease/amidase